MFKNIEERILFEDNHIIIVNKLPSEIVQGDKTGDQPLSELLKEFLVAKYNKPGAAFLGVVHRLDRPVSGGVIFAKTSKALGRLNSLLREHEIKKVYWAIVKDKPPAKSGVLDQYIIKKEKSNKSFISEVPKNGYKNAVLSYEVIDKSDKYFLLRIELETGRHHQIRAQLASIGCPIKGDLKYGFARSNKDASIHLHAYSIEFIHPVKKEPVAIIAKPPEDPLWNYFYFNRDHEKN